MAAKKKTPLPRTFQQTVKAARSGKTAAPPPAAASDPAQAAPAVSAASPANLSALEAAALVLSESQQAMTCPELIAAMAAQGYWTSPAGKTPQATLHTAVTMLPKLAPRGATVKRARSDPVDDSDLFGLDLDAFHEAANDLAACVPVGVIESVGRAERQPKP
jgi:hypothetical protein